MSQNTPADNDDVPTQKYDTPAAEQPTAEHPAAERPAAEQSAAEQSAERPAKKPVLRRGSTWAIAGGGLVAALVLVGGGAALGAALADDDRPGVFGGGPAGDRGPLGDDDDRGGPGPAGPRDDRGPERGDDRGPDAGMGGAETGAADASELTGIVAKAAGADGVEGDPTKIEARRGGAWEVTFETSTGAETEVHVDADGTARVVRTETDDDDSAPTATLSDAAIESIVSAALAEADGTILEIEADDDTSPYEVRMLLTDGGRMEIDLGADFAVTGTETRS